MLIKCKECGKEISDQAVSCPHCGIKIDKPQEKEEHTLKIIGKVTLFIVVISFLWALLYMFRTSSVDGYSVGDKVMVHMNNSEKWAGEINSIQFFSVTCWQSGLGGQRVYFTLPRNDISFIERFDSQY